MTVMTSSVIVCKRVPRGDLLPAIWQNKTPPIKHLDMLGKGITNSLLNASLEGPRPEKEKEIKTRVKA